MSRRNLNYTKEEVLNAIYGSKTIMTTIAQRLGCTWDTAKKFVNKWNETKKAYEAEREGVNDKAESELFKLIEQGSEGAIKWYLSKKAKDRGYSDEQNINFGNAEGSGAFNFAIVDATPQLAGDLINDNESANDKL